MNTPTPFRSRDIKALQQVYVDRLREHIAEMYERRMAIEKSIVLAHDAEFLFELSNRLKGSGGTFGFPDISDAADKLYSSLTTFRRCIEQSAARDELVPEIAAKLRTLEETCQRAIQERCLPQVSDGGSSAEDALGEEAQSRAICIYCEDADFSEDVIAQLQHFGYAVYATSDWGKLELVVANTSLRALVIYGSPHNLQQAIVDLGIKGRGGVPHTTPIIAISPMDDFESRLVAVRYGANAYFNSNVDALQLVDKIEHLHARGKNTTNYNVLIIDDDDMLSEFCAQVLTHHGMTALALTDPSEVLGALDSQSFDAILIDYAMPGCDGEELAAIIRQLDCYLSIPIIFMSAKASVSELVGDTELGAEDFLYKPFTEDQLFTVVRSRAARSAELRSLMLRDSLTGLYNHAYMIDALQDEASRIRRQGGQSAYVILDIDHFKAVNDTYGHQVGDSVIKMLSQFLKHRLRRSDIVGRCGGEEFAVIMRSVDAFEARDKVNELRNAFSVLSCPSAEGKNVSATFSAGVGTIAPGSSAEEVTRAADEALYSAKSSGRNMVMMG